MALFSLLRLARTTQCADAAATTMLLFRSDSHHTSEGAVQRVASADAQQTVPVPASPVSSDVSVDALLLFRIRTAPRVVLMDDVGWRGT